MLGIAIVLGAMATCYYLFTQNIMSINALLIATLVILFVIGILLVLVNVPSSTVMMKMIDKDKFGKVSSVSSIGSQGLIPLSMFLGGIAITYISPVGLLFACFGGLLVVALILFFAPSVREL